MAVAAIDDGFFDYLAFTQGLTLSLPADLLVMAWLQMTLLVDVATLYKVNLKGVRARREVLDLFVRASIPFSIEFFSAQTLRQSAAAFWTSSLSGAVPVTAVDGFQLSEPRAVVAMLNAGLGID